jgi:hypothetical protein
MYKTGPDTCNKCYSICKALEEGKKSDIINLEKLLKRLELFGFAEMAVK